MILILIRQIVSCKSGSFVFCISETVLPFKLLDFQVLDASWYMPDEQRNPIQEYQVVNLVNVL